MKRVTIPQRSASLACNASRESQLPARNCLLLPQFRAEYDNTVARYRQTVLTAFQQVEDNLSAMRILAGRVAQQEDAVKSSERYLNLAEDRYKLGIDSYLNVITAQTTYLLNRQTLVNLREQQMTASGQLVEALGGGWSASEVPTAKQLLSKAPLNTEDGTSNTEN